MKDVPRIHIQDEVIRESHSIMLPQIDLRKPLRLSGTFYYFESQSLMDKDIKECENMDMVLVTPDSKLWNQHCNSYAEQEENFIYIRG